MQAQYHPYMSGVYSTKPGFHKLGHNFGNPNDGDMFQIDSLFQQYRNTKLAVRRSRPKYCGRSNSDSTIEGKVATFIADTLVREHGTPHFSTTSSDDDRILLCHLSNTLTLSKEGMLVRSKCGNPVDPQYADSLDALACQVQEDIVIHRCDGEKDWMAYYHACMPSGWKPEERVGKSFAEIHSHVPGMDLSKSSSHVRLMIHGGSFVRFVWGVYTDNNLDKYPTGERKPFDPKNPELYVRVERQVTVGFPDVSAVLFLIRPYHYDAFSLPRENKLALARSIDSLTPEQAEYKGLADRERIVSWLQT